MIGVFALLLVAAPAGAAPTFPALTGRVVDQAGLLSAATEARITKRAAALEAQTGAQLVVVTVPNLQGYEIEEFGNQLGRDWGIGQSDEDDGALLIVAKEERKVRIEVGYGLEPVLTDAWCAVTIRREIVPAFRSGDYDGGVVAGVDAIATQLGADPAQQQLALEAARGDRDLDPGPGAEAMIWLVIILLLVVMAITRGRRGRGGGSSGIPWGGGGFSGGGRGGGGGFSGGGGSFGGGGASGSW